jgi:hypothetical protein
MNPKLLSGIPLVPIFFYPLNRQNAECLSAEEEAIELQRIMASAPEDGIAPDREEMMEQMMRAQKNRKLP